MQKRKRFTNERFLKCSNISATCIYRKKEIFLLSNYTTILTFQLENKDIRCFFWTVFFEIIISSWEIVFSGNENTKSLENLTHIFFVNKFKLIFLTNFPTNGDGWPNEIE